MINERLKLLRVLMSEKKIDAYIVPSEDFHQSEYVGEYFKSREFISGFDGSAGMVIVTPTEAHLWTDGRYFTQAEIQLKGSEFILERQGMKGVKSPIQFLSDTLQDGAILGFDGRCVSVGMGDAYEAVIAEKNGQIIYDVDFINQIWNDRPALSTEPAFFLEKKYSGEDSKDKVARIRQEMKKFGADTHIISSLDDVCWIINSRGNDVACSPLILSYAVITMDEFHLFVDKNKFNSEINANLETINAKLHDYNDIYEFVKGIAKDSRVLIDSARLNYALYNNIPKEVKRIDKLNPSQLFKAMKNDVELENIRMAHVKDGIAWAKFMCWIKKNIKDIELTEIEASDKLESYRKEHDTYLWPSFSPISGYREHGAIVHYSATEETNKKLEPASLYLSDTGGNYYEGSSDITRTLALGELNAEEKEHFTLVLKCHANVALAKFLKGTTGHTVDMLAKQPVWERGMDYNHGTGHGVGYLLNVHEGPHSLSYRMNPKRISHPFMPGMVVTDEPGLYIVGKHGIRIESEMIVNRYMETEYGEFFGFEMCTYVPIDLDAIDVSMLNERERGFLNDYHKLVFDTISPYLEGEEKEFLKEYTRAV